MWGLMLFYMHAVVSRVPLRIISSADNGVMNKDGEFVHSNASEAEFEAEIVPDTKGSPRMKIFNRKDQILIVEKDSLAWGEEDTPSVTLWTYTPTDSEVGMISNSKGKCLYKKDTTVTLKECPADALSWTSEYLFILDLQRDQKRVEMCRRILEKEDSMNKNKGGSQAGNKSPEGQGGHGAPKNANDQKDKNTGDVKMNENTGYEDRDATKDGPARSQDAGNRNNNGNSNGQRDSTPQNNGNSHGNGNANANGNAGNNNDSGNASKGNDSGNGSGNGQRDSTPQANGNGSNNGNNGSDSNNGNGGNNGGGGNSNNDSKKSAKPSTNDAPRNDSNAADANMDQDSLNSVLNTLIQLIAKYQDQIAGRSSSGSGDSS